MTDNIYELVKKEVIKMNENKTNINWYSGIYANTSLSSDEIKGLVK